MPDIYHAADPSAKRKSRLVAEYHPEVLEGDARLLLQAMRDRPLELLTPWGVENWCRAHDPAWTNGYTKSVRARVMEIMRDNHGADQTREMLLNLSTSLTAQCREYVTGTGASYGGKDGHSEGTIILRHPDDGTLMWRVQHRDIQGYLRIIGELTGVLNAKGSVKVEVNISVAERLERARARLRVSANSPTGTLEKMLEADYQPPIKTIETKVEPEYDF